jgi:hypothetical protein
MRHLRRQSLVGTNARQRGEAKVKVKVNYVGKIEGLTFEGVKRFKIDKNENNTFKRIRIEKDNGQVHLIAEKYVSGFEIEEE